MNKNISKTGLTAGRPLPGMARMVKPEIVIEGKIIRHFKHFRLDQSAITHHSFELTLPHDALEPVQNHRLNEAQHFLGKRITIVFRYKDHESDSPERTFVGVVTRVAFSQQHMSLGDIILRGGSPTLLLDAAPHFQSFGGEKPVNTAFIAQSIINQGLGSQKFDVRIQTQNKSYISYSSQYNETHYNYLARIAEAYGEQFYYDGETLHFGTLPPHEKPLTLTYGSSVNKVSVELNATYIKPRYFGYNSSTHQRMKSIDQTVKHPGELPGQAYELNQDIYKTDSFIPVPLAANMELDVDHSQQSSRGSAATEVFTVSGETMIPFLYPGCVADLEMRKPDSNTTSYFTRIMIAEVSHEVDALGNYKGSFKAIAEGTGFLPRPEFTVPKAAPQVATVISNTDPQSQGRIRVRFQWQDGNASTHFIRMMSPDAGGTGAVQQNRGFVAVPEVGDQVMVDFEYRHPDFPFAMGGMFHGKNGRGGGSGNHLKSIQTRSGIRVLMNDLDKSLTIEDPSGNSYFMDGKGNIRITAPGNMEFSAGKDIIMNSGKNLEVKTGNSMEFMSGNLAAFHMISGTVFSTPLMEMSVPVHLNIQSGKTSLLSEEETTIQGKTTNVAGLEKLMIHSDQETTVNSKGTTHVLGKDGNSHSNIPRDYNPLEKKMDGRCLVNFRPLETWNGDDYGFDWVRAGDTGMKGDINYLKIMGKIEDGRFIKYPSEYQRLISTFSHYVYNHTFEDGSTESRTYAFPYLSLYPRSYFRNSGGQKIKVQSPYSNTTAVLRTFIDIRESPEKITLQYDKKKFRIVHNPFPLTKGNHTLYFTVTCLEEFDTKKKIEVFASYRNSEGRIRKVLAGGMIVKSNHKRYDTPILFIKVITNVGNGNRIPVIPENIKYEIRKYLNQALINPIFESPLVLNCCTDTSAATGNKHMRQSQFNKYASPERDEEDKEDDIIYLNLNRNKTKLMEFLKNEIDIYYPGKYDNAIKVFFINELARVGKDMRAGSGYANEKTVLLYYGGYDSPHITAHEIMHALGLKHTFSKESLFTFMKHKTDNIMDYSDNAEMGEHNISTYHWQWNTMQNHAQRELSPNNFVDYK